jgi:rhodanese-related sulfurtransferase
MSKPETRNQKPETGRARTLRRFLVSGFWFLVSGLTLSLVLSCKTVGISTSPGGYSEVESTVAAEMILDSQQIVVLDVRPVAAYRGPSGHIAGSLNAPFNTIEHQLPLLLPYQNQTVLVYGESSTDGSVAAKLLSVAGFRNVVHIAGGLRSWIEHGYRTVNSQ